MVEINALERQLADESLRIVGPEPVVDDAAIFSAVTATQTPKWRFQSMFSTTKFIVAGVLVALFGGLLLAGVMTTPESEKVVPAAATASSSPMTTDELLSGMVTEQVEPSVQGIVNDGVRDLARSSPGWEGAGKIVAGHDGSVWIFSPSGFHRLGDEVEHEWAEATGPEGDIEIGPDGTIWYANEHGPRDLLAYDGEEWTVSMKAPGTGAVRELEMDATGTLWAGWKDDRKRVTSIGYLDETGSWNRVGSWPQEKGDFRGPLLSATGEGEVWLLIEHPVGGDIWHLLDVDSKGWEPLKQPAGDIVRLHATPAGTMWARNADREIIYYDGDDWVVYDRSDGVPSIDHGWPNRHSAPDGSFWLPVFDPIDGRCDGVANFDGTEWSKHLQGFCIHALDVAGDGIVWLQASDQLEGPAKTFVITPEAVAATE